MNQESKQSMNTENWIGTGVALGSLFFVLVSEPVWIAVGIAIGAALDWNGSKNRG